jgi:hypothetical protein
LSSQRPGKAEGEAGVGTVSTNVFTCKTDDDDEPTRGKRGRG